MQNDNAFEGRVFSFTEDVPRNRQEVLDHLRGDGRRDQGSIPAPNPLRLLQVQTLPFPARLHHQSAACANGERLKRLALPIRAMLRL